MKRMILIAAASALVLAGCAQNPYTGEHKRTATGATVGAGAGAALGQLIGGDTKGTLIGAAVGATVGGLVGRQMDQQERQLREEMAGTGVDVQREGDTIRLQAPESITFDTDSADIKPQFQGPLANIAESVRQYPNTVVRVEGHTDSTGSASYNQNLSLNRAESVTSYLAREGVDPARMQAVGYGFSRPIATNDTPEGRAQNRRVEILILPQEQ